MDKLKKVLVYQFWILLGITILLPLVTWFIFSGKLMADAASREAAIKGVWDALPKGPELPNNEWNAQVSKRNDEQTVKVATAWNKIWEIQKSRMTWPNDLAGITDPLKASTRDLDVYRSKYLDEVRAVWRLANPIIFEEKIGNVDFPFELVPREEFGSLPPTPQQMKDAQEDLWLLAALFRGIADTNEGALTINDAPVRQVQGVKLMGGTPRAAGGAAPPPPMGGEAAAGSGNGAGDGGFSSSMGGRMTMGGGGGADQVDFDPRDEFGPDDLAGAGGPMGGGESSSGGSAMPGGGMPGSFGGGMGATIPRKRYIDENPKWKTRGFYLKVVVDHRRLPDFLVQLTNRSWPVKITRVHQTDLLPEDLATQDGGAGGAAPVAGGGAFGGGGGMPGSATAGHGGPMGRMPPAFGGGSAGGGADGGGLGFGRPRFGGNGGESSAGGGGAFGGGFPGGTPAGGDPNNPTSAAALNDPMLAIVAISGVITIYNPPTADPTAQPAGQQQPGQTPPGTAPAVDPTAATAAVTPPADGTAPAVPPATTPAATTPPADAATTATGTAPPVEATAPAAAPTPATPPAATAPGGAATPPPAEKPPGT